MKTSLTLVMIAALTATAATAQPAVDPVRPAAGVAASEAAASDRRQAAVVLDELDRALSGYVFQARVPGARRMLRDNRAAYLAVATREDFARRLTADIGGVLDDKHFYVQERAGTPAAGRGGSPEERARAEAETGYGIASVRRLPGNVGYLDLRNFSSSDAGARRIEAAMDLLSDTGALIIDLRGNRGGGGTAMAALVGRLASKPIPRSVLIWRNDDGSEERVAMEVRDYPAAERYGRPVYVLTSNITVSAAEAFAYDIQAAGRVTVIGEATRGGANPMNRPLVDLGEGMVAYIANGRSEHPVTKGTPNGAGVQPDVRSPPEAALGLAYARALEGISPASPDSRFGRELAQAKADPQAALARAFEPTPS